MVRFKLKLDQFKLERYSEVQFDANFHSTRQHCNLDIFYGQRCDEVMKMTENFDLSHVRKLELCGSNSFTASRFLENLSQMPLLEKLKINIFKIDMTNESQAANVVLRKLKYITIDSVNCEILNFIKANALTEIDIGGYRVPTENNINALVTCLENSENLEVLKLNEFTFNGIFTPERQTKFPFKLKQFHMSYSTSTNSSICNNFNKFLVAQSKSIKVLDLSYAQNVSKAVFATIFNRIKGLITLRIHPGSLPSSREFYEKVKVIETLRELLLSDNFPGEFADGLLANCPNIEELKIRGYISDAVNHLAYYNRSLSKLSVDRIICSVEDGATFGMLKCLSVQRLEIVDDWLSVIINSPLIQTLEVRWVDKDKINNSVIEVLIQQLSLRDLKFDGDYDEIKIIYDVIKHGYGSLKSLDLTMNETSEFGTTVTASVKFDFPENSSDWNVQEQDAKFDNAWDQRSW